MTKQIKNIDKGMFFIRKIKHSVFSRKQTHPFCKFFIKIVEKGYLKIRFKIHFLKFKFLLSIFKKAKIVPNKKIKILKKSFYVNILWEQGAYKKIQLGFPLFFNTVFSSKLGRNKQEIKNIQSLLLETIKTPFDYKNITKEMIFNWHKILFKKNTYIHSIGCYRKQMVFISKVKMIPVDQINKQMEQLLLSLKNKDKTHPFLLGSRFLYQFFIIHPFQDGNGRLGRFLINMIFLQEGLPPFILEKNQPRFEYGNIIYKSRLMQQSGESYPEEAFNTFVIKQLNSFLIKSLKNIYSSKS